MITGNITGAGSDTALIDLVTPASPRNSSLGAVVNDALANSASLMQVVVLLAAGTASFGSSCNLSGGTFTGGAAFNPTGAVRSLDDWRSSIVPASLTGFTAGSLTPSTAGSVALGGVLAEVLDPAESRFSLGAFVDAIDRVFQAMPSPPTEIAIIVDQANQTVTVNEYSVAPTVANDTATFTRTPAAAAVSQWGE